MLTKEQYQKRNQFQCHKKLKHQIVVSVNRTYNHFVRSSLCFRVKNLGRKRKPYLKSGSMRSNVPKNEGIYPDHAIAQPLRRFGQRSGINTIK